MASKNVQELTVETFDKTVDQGVCLVDFWAPWCGPCRMQGPILEDVAGNVPEGTVVAKVNVDESPALAIRYGIQSIPALLIMRNGEVVKQFVGVQTASVLRQAIESAAMPA